MNDYVSASLVKVGTDTPVRTPKITRLSTLASAFAEQPTASQLAEDPIVYRVERVEPLDDSTPEFSLTIIYPGVVGTEFFFTRGHDHQPAKGETYHCISGRGGLIVEQDNIFEWLPMEPGSVVQLRAGWAHRTINTGTEPLIFAGQYITPFEVDYSISESGFSARVHDDGDAGIQIIPK